MYNYTKEHFAEWFPDLPSYQKFSYRMGKLTPAIVSLVAALIDIGEVMFPGTEQALDSLPIMVANQARSGTAKVAAGLCSKGYCATKKLYYYGVKLHAVGTLRPGPIPFPAALLCSRASDYDLTVAKSCLQLTPSRTLYGDKAYCDKGWEEESRDT